MGADAWDVNAVKRQLAELHERGSLSEVLPLLSAEGKCAPVECEILDYKRVYEPTALGNATLVKDIASFFNSFGGFLVIGVDEATSDESFEVCGVDSEPIAQEQLKALLREYLGTRIQISCTRLEVKKGDGSTCPIDIVYIPKRPLGQQPVAFAKNGPDAKPSKPIFLSGAFYYRNGDECLEARGSKILDLQRDPRWNPYLAGKDSKVVTLQPKSRLPHNLPDRNVICRHFVGREALLDQIWAWVGDDLSHVKVLAGEGGRGKTSIAYEFAEQLSEHANAPFEQVVWLTAKRQQFSGVQDKYLRMPETHYSSYPELLTEVSRACGMLDLDLEDLSLPDLKRHAKSALNTVPSFVVIDDIDSLCRDEQRQALELGQLLGGTPSKLLFTTRENPSVSHDLSIQVPGLHPDEAGKFVDFLRLGINFPPLSDAQRRKLHEITNGSPLYIESLCRLLRFYQFADAIEQWKGQEGASVRAAALEREISLLSPEARRCLLVISIMQEASLAELAAVIGYDKQKLRGAIDELQTLFLIDAPSLAQEPRFRVNAATALLVIDRKSTLVSDFARVEKKIAEFRGAPKGEGTVDRRVGVVISQAAALVRQKDLDRALRTMDEGIERTKAHKDLLGYKAYLLINNRSEELAEGRRLAKEAHAKGCKKPWLLDVWFEAEWNSENFPEAEAIADSALGSDDIADKKTWHIRKAASIASQADKRRANGDADGAIQHYLRAADSLMSAIAMMSRRDAEEWTIKGRELTDQAWVIARASARDVTGYVRALDLLEKILDRGDTRVVIIKRMISMLEALVEQLRRQFGKPSSASVETAISQIHRVSHVLAKRENIYPQDTRHEDLRNAIEQCQDKLNLLVTS